MSHCSSMMPLNNNSLQLTVFDANSDFTVDDIWFWVKVDFFNIFTLFSLMYLHPKVGTVLKCLTK